MHLPISENPESPPHRGFPEATDSREQHSRQLGPQSPVAFTRPQRSTGPPSPPLHNAPGEPEALQQGQNVDLLHRKLAGIIAAAASLFRHWPLRPFMPQIRPEANPPQEPHPERERDGALRFGRDGFPRLGAVIPVAVVDHPPSYTPAPSYHSDDNLLAAGDQSLSM